MDQVKSTLVKIICGLLTPSEGIIKIDQKITPLGLFKLEKIDWLYTSGNKFN